MLSTCVSLAVEVKLPPSHSAASAHHTLALGKFLSLCPVPLANVYMPASACVHSCSHRCRLRWEQLPTFIMSKIFHSPIKRRGRRPTNAWTSEQAREMNAKRWKSVREEREKLFKEMSTVTDDVLEGVVNAYAVMPEGMSSVSPKQANVALQALRHKQSRQLMGKVDPTLLLNRLVDMD